MKQFILAGCILQGTLFAQTEKVPDLPVKLTRISTPFVRIEPSETDSLTIMLKMDFNGAVPRNGLEKIKIHEIESISLLYTKYRLSETFDQLNLNARRMDRLYAAMPGLKENRSVKWYWVEQTGCGDPESCDTYFHGFIIRLKKSSEALRIEKEMALLDYYTSVYSGDTLKESKVIDSLIASGKLKLIKVCDTLDIIKLNRSNRMAKIRGWNTDVRQRLGKLLKKELEDSGITRLDLILDKKGDFTFLDNSSAPHRASRVLKLLNDRISAAPARFNNKKIPSELVLVFSTDESNSKTQIQIIQKPILPDGKLFDADAFLYIRSREIRCDYRDTSVTAKETTAKPMLSSTPDLIFKVFNRNPQWRKSLVVTDVTGSMYPYLAQFRAWHKLNMELGKSSKAFVFFNDGDNKPDMLKIRGKVGGLYYSHTLDFEELSASMSTAMKNGGGGDGPENNIEAAIEGLKAFPECKELVMIADNWATPRDLALLNKVNVPIRLVLCGTHFNGFNTAYLDMIRKNGGSIHTIEKDLFDLAKMMDGQTIVLDGIVYRLENGNFVKAAESSLRK